VIQDVTDDAEMRGLSYLGIQIQSCF